MIRTIRDNYKKALTAKIFSILTIGTLSFLSFKTSFGLFLVGSFGASMVLVFGYPESPFSQPKNVFFGHFITSLVGVLALNLFSIEQHYLFLQIAIAVGFAIFLMILLGVTHPPAGGNPIFIILGGANYQFLLNPIILGSAIIIIYGIILNRFILKKNYPINWKI
jgi:CBS-domain-containing membrane protein